MKKSALLILFCALAVGLVVSLPARADDVSSLKRSLSKAASADKIEDARNIMMELAGKNNAAAADAIIDNLYKMKSNVAMLDAAKTALRLMTDEGARKAIAKGAEKEKAFQARVVLAEILGDHFNTEALVELLDDRNDIVIKTAARALGDIKEKSAVKPLIDALKKHDKKKDGPFWDINTALQKITGKSIQDYGSWINWFADGAGLKECDPTRYKPGLTDKGGELSTIFGLKIDSRRVIVIIDVSGSMEITDPLPEGYSGPDPGLSTDTEEDLKKKEEEAAKRAEERRKALKEDRKRIVRAKKELVNCVKGFGPAVKFNIIAYSDEIWSWKEELTEASEKNKDDAIAFVKKLEADGLTHTDDAIKEAFSKGMGHRKGNTDDDRPLTGPKGKFDDDEVDTIILITDGAPTHMGGGGGRHMPPDSQMIIDEILSWVKKENRFRKITIHTMGFLGANKDFLKQLADENNGSFRDIK